MSVSLCQLINRKQYIEYKLKLASRIGGEGSNLSSSDRAQLISELTDIQNSADQLVRQYEKKHGESYFKYQQQQAVPVAQNGLNGSGAYVSGGGDTLASLASGPYQQAASAFPTTSGLQKQQQGVGFANGSNGMSSGNAKSNSPLPTGASSQFGSSRR